MTPLSGLMSSPGRPLVWAASVLIAMVSCASATSAGASRSAVQPPISVVKREVSSRVSKVAGVLREWHLFASAGTRPCPVSASSQVAVRVAQVRWMRSVSSGTVRFYEVTHAEVAFSRATTAEAFVSEAPTARHIACEADAARRADAAANGGRPTAVRAVGLPLELASRYRARGYILIVHVKGRALFYHQHLLITDVADDRLTCNLDLTGPGEPPFPARLSGRLITACTT